LFCFFFKKKEDQEAEKGEDADKEKENDVVQAKSASACAEERAVARWPPTRLFSRSQAKAAQSSSHPPTHAPTNRVTLKPTSSVTTTSTGHGKPTKLPTASPERKHDDDGNDKGGKGKDKDKKKNKDSPKKTKKSSSRLEGYDNVGNSGMDDLLNLDWGGSTSAAPPAPAPAAATTATTKSKDSKVKKGNLWQFLQRVKNVDILYSVTGTGSTINVALKAVNETTDGSTVSVEVAINGAINSKKTTNGEFYVSSALEILTPNTLLVPAYFKFDLGSEKSIIEFDNFIKIFFNNDTCI
jgi:hypothetical protein